MKHYTPEISWHSRDALSTIDMQKTPDGAYRFATAAFENIVPSIRLWECHFDAQNKLQVDFVADLRKKHTRPINVVRFSPDGTRLAAGDMESVILIWQRNDSKIPDIFADVNDEMPPNKECWQIEGTKRLRSHQDDVCDLAWSPDGRYIASVSVDKSLIIYDAVEYCHVQIIRDFAQFPNGVCWDPRGKYVVALSCDRRLSVYDVKINEKTQRPKLTKHAVVTKASIKGVDASADTAQADTYRIFFDDQLMSFVRRPCFTPDGEFLLTPSGALDLPGRTLNTTYAFTRGAFDSPCVVMPSGPKPSFVVRCCPVVFRLKSELSENVMKLPYRVVFAVLTANAVLLYDTQQSTPFAYVNNIHYSTLTDLTWSFDGRLLLVCSTDGYLTVVRFDAGELGDDVTDEMTASAAACPPLSPPRQTRAPKATAQDKDNVVKTTPGSGGAEAAQKTPKADGQRRPSPPGELGDDVTDEMTASAAECSPLSPPRPTRAPKATTHDKDNVIKTTPGSAAAEAAQKTPKADGQRRPSPPGELGDDVTDEITASAAECSPLSPPRPTRAPKATTHDKDNVIKTTPGSAAAEAAQKTPKADGQRRPSPPGELGDDVTDEMTASAAECSPLSPPRPTRAPKATTHDKDNVIKTKPGSAAAEAAQKTPKADGQRRPSPPGELGDDVTDEMTASAAECSPLSPPRPTRAPKATTHDKDNVIKTTPGSAAAEAAQKTPKADGQRRPSPPGELGDDVTDEMTASAAECSPLSPPRPTRAPKATTHDKDNVIKTTPGSAAAEAAQKTPKADGQRRPSPPGELGDDVTDEMTASAAECSPLSPPRPTRAPKATTHDKDNVIKTTPGSAAAEAAQKTPKADGQRRPSPPGELGDDVTDEMTASAAECSPLSPPRPTRAPKATTHDKDNVIKTTPGSAAAEAAQKTPKADGQRRPSPPGELGDDVTDEMTASAAECSPLSPPRPTRAPKATTHDKDNVIKTTPGSAAAEAAQKTPKADGQRRPSPPGQAASANSSESKTTAAKGTASGDRRKTANLVDLFKKIKDRPATGTKRDSAVRRRLSADKQGAASAVEPKPKDSVDEVVIVEDDSGDGPVAVTSGSPPQKRGRTDDVAPAIVAGCGASVAKTPVDIFTKKAPRRVSFLSLSTSTLANSASCSDGNSAPVNANAALPVVSSGAVCTNRPLGAILAPRTPTNQQSRGAASSPVARSETKTASDEKRTLPDAQAVVGQAQKTVAPKKLKESDVTPAMAKQPKRAQLVTIN